MSISLFEIIVVFLVALILFGPEQLPVMARQFGKLTAELRKTSNALRREWYNAVYPPAEEIRRELKTHTAELSALKNEVMAPSKNDSPTVSPTDSAQIKTGANPDTAVKES